MKRATDAHCPSIVYHRLGRDQARGLIDRGRASGFILEGPSNYAPPTRQVKVVWSLDGLSCYFCYTLSTRSPLSSPSSSRSSASAPRPENDDRAACAVRRRVKLMGAVVVQLTLTCGGTRFKSWSEVMGAISAWLKYLRRRGLDRRLLGSDYVAIAEPHKGGQYWHAHMVCARGRYTQADLALLRATWTRVLLRLGYPLSPNAQYHRVHARVKGSRSAGSYCAKYITKSIGMGRPAGRARYFGSRLTLKSRAVYLSVRKFLAFFDTASYVDCYLVDIYGTRVLSGYLYFDLLGSPPRAP